MPAAAWQHCSKLSVFMALLTASLTRCGEVCLLMLRHHMRERRSNMRTCSALSGEVISMLTRLLMQLLIGLVTRLLANYTVPPLGPPRVLGMVGTNSIEHGPLENMSVRQLVFFFGAQLLSVLLHRLLGLPSATGVLEQSNATTNGTYRALNVISDLASSARLADERLMQRNSAVVAYVNSINGGKGA